MHGCAGIADAYWELRIKPWDVAAGTLLVTEAGASQHLACSNRQPAWSPACPTRTQGCKEPLRNFGVSPLTLASAGGTITTMDGKPHSVFSRSHLASNGKLHDVMMKKTKPAIEELISNGNDFAPWFIPEGADFFIPGRDD